MRAWEILKEDYNQSLQSDLQNILIGAKGSGASEINTNDLITQLQSMGYSIDVNSLIPLLSNDPSIANVTPEMISLTNQEGTDGMDGEDSASRVSDMAQQATQKQVK
jgi:hypothetical protein